MQISFEIKLSLVREHGPGRDVAVKDLVGPVAEAIENSKDFWENYRAKKQQRKFGDGEPRDIWGNKKKACRVD